MLNASNDTISLQRLHIGAGKGDHGLRSVSECTCHHIIAIDKIHIYIGSQVLINTEREQIVCCLMSLMCCNIWIASIADFGSRHAIAVNIRESMHIWHPLFMGSKEKGNSGRLLHLGNVS